MIELRESAAVPLLGLFELKTTRDRGSSQEFPAEAVGTVEPVARTAMSPKQDAADDFSLDRLRSRHR